MKKIKIENGKIYSESFGRTDVFEIIGRIPEGFQIWNIGENMGTHDYIPLCERLHPEDKDNYEINIKTLKAIKVDPEEWKKLDKAVNSGIGNLREAEKALNSKRKGYWSDRKRAAAQSTIEIFRRFSE